MVDGGIAMNVKHTDAEKQEREYGIRRDGSYYTRIEWASHTTQTPLYWICNLIDDDLERDGGSWGANTLGPANAILSFFGERQPIGRIRIFHNVGATVSLIEELASLIHIYVSDDDRCRRLGDENADLDQVQWERILTCEMEKREGWFEFSLSKPVLAKYVRIELVCNFGTPLPWTETNELKLYPPAE